MSSPSASLQILIVEDDSLVTAWMERLIIEMGYRPAGHATSSVDAIVIADKLRPDLALVDLHLTDGLTGIEVARRLTESCAAVVLFITASRQHIPDDYAGACGLLSKPYTEGELRAALRYLETCIHEGSSKSPPPHALSLSPDYVRRWQSD